VTSKVLVTGVGGLVGSAVAERFHSDGWGIVGVDNDLRGTLLKDPAASTQWNIDRLSSTLPEFANYSVDVRDRAALATVFLQHDEQWGAIVHCAAQSSHEGNLWDDFSVNAVGTLNLLGLWKERCPEIPFVYMSTIKVYGDYPNQLHYILHDARLDLLPNSPYYRGFDEHLPVGEGTSSFFGRSKAAADSYVREYAFQYGMRAVCFRASCITGGYHSGAEAHGMLSYLMKCAITKTPYRVFGFGGRQVRDQLHAEDMAQAIYAYVHGSAPRSVYNIGGGRENACSILEAIELCERITGNKVKYSLHRERHGDHRWWVSNNALFKQDHPAWEITYSVEEMLQEIYERGKDRWIAT